MFWTIVGALLFVFVGIPLIVRILAIGIYSLTFPMTWRVLCSIFGFGIGIWGYYGVPRDETNWFMIGIQFLGLYMMFLGVIGSFSLEKWKEFWSDKDKINNGEENSQKIKRWLSSFRAELSMEKHPYLFLSIIFYIFLLIGIWTGLIK